MKKLWHWIVFIGALLALASLILILTRDLTNDQRKILEAVELAILSIFALDLFNEYRNFKGSKIRFTREHWLDLIAVIPFFRIIRIAEIAKFEKLARLTEITEIEKTIVAEEAISDSIHATHLKDQEDKENSGKV